FAERNFIERNNRFVTRTFRDRKRECAFSGGVAPFDPFVQPGLKTLKFAAVVFAFTGVQIQAFVPAAFVKNAFFGFAAKKFFANFAAAFALENIHFVEQFDQM